MLQSAALSALPGIRHAFFTREGGVSGGPYTSLNGGTGSQDVPARVVENRARMAEALGVAPDRLLTAYQIHSPDVVTIERPWPTQERPRADAIVTRAPGIAIGVTTADCGPVLFADGAARVIGAAHAGWRGAFTGVLEATIAAMEQCGAERSRIVAVLGPTIRQPNYEVGPEFVERFTAADARNARFFEPSVTPGPRHVRSAGLHRGAADAAPASTGSRMSPAALTPIRSGSSATAARRMPKSRTMGATSTRSRSTG